MNGPMGEMGSLLKQAQEMQRALDRAREELREATVEGTAGGGAVRVTVTGDRQVTRIEITEEVYGTGDKSMLEDLVVAALRDGLGRAHDLAEERIGRVTGGVSLPGFF